MSGVLQCGLGSSEHDGLVATKPSCFFHATTFHGATRQVLLGARYEEGHVQLEGVQSGEIDVASIHDVESTWLQGKVIEGVDIVHFPAGNVDETGDVAAQVDQGMELDGRLASTKPCPREEGQAQIDGGGIESVDGLFQIDGQRFARIQLAGAGNENVREIGVDAPVAFLVGLGERVPRDVAPDARVIEFGLHRVQADLDVAKADPVGQLGEG